MDTEIEDRSYVESSRGGAVMVELDRRGHVLRVQLEAEVNATWSADLLGERIVALYTVALMRARCDERARMNERGADMPPGEVYPSQDEIARYRADHVDF